MTVISLSRRASYDELAAEMDRRGRVIEGLEKQISQFKAAMKMPDAERRQWFIRYCLDTTGYFNRADICDAFSVSVPQASLDIRKWLDTNPTGAIYNASRRRYEVQHV